VAEEALGDEQKQALQDAFSGATAAMLVEIARYAALDRNLPGRLEEEFGRFFDDSWVAETLVDVALSSRTPPVEDLRQRYEQLGSDPRELPIGFERAMRILARELALRLREGARAGGPLAGVVLVADVEAMREMLERIERESQAWGPGASANVSPINYEHARPAQPDDAVLERAQRLLEGLPLDCVPEPGGLPAGSKPPPYARTPFWWVGKGTSWAWRRRSRTTRVDRPPSSSAGLAASARLSWRVSSPTATDGSSRGGSTG